MFCFNNALPRQRAARLALAFAVGIAGASLASGGLQAQGMDMKNMPSKGGSMKDMPAEKGTAMKTGTGTGTVTAVNPAGRKLTLDHGPIPAIDWPAMKMEFPVAASVDLSKVKAGDRVQFTLSGSGSSYTVQSVSPGQ